MSAGAANALSSIPIVSPIAKYKGRLLLDGGVALPMPIEKSTEDGNFFHVIMLTQNKGYEMRPFNRLTIRSDWFTCNCLINRIL